MPTMQKELPLFEDTVHSRRHHEDLDLNTSLTIHETVTTASQYRNAQTLWIRVWLGVDVLDRHIDPWKIAQPWTSQHRVGTAFHCEIYYWCSKNQSICARTFCSGSIEKTMELKSTNISVPHKYGSVSKRLIYKPHPSRPRKTIWLKNIITVRSQSRQLPWRADGKCRYHQM